MPSGSIFRFPAYQKKVKDLKGDAPMKTSEELNVLKEEELEHVVGGEKIPDNGYDPDAPGITVTCKYSHFDPIKRMPQCDLSKADRTQTQCENCPLNDFF